MKKNEIITTEYLISSPKIPEEFNGFTIAHISDSHARPAGGILQAVEALHPDITVITGDMLHGIKRDTAEFDAFLKSLTKISPVYMVTGNHDTEIPDFEKIFDRYEKSGAFLLDNSGKIFEKNGKKISLLGIGDPVSKKRAVIKENIKTGCQKLPRSDVYEILLFHRANLLDEVKACGFDLILSGHIHGGQIRIPKIGGLLSPFSCLRGGYRMIFPKYCQGRYISCGTTMLVNAGMCNTLPIPRWGNPFEIGKVVLNHL